jgi:hypothetical protein
MWHLRTIVFMATAAIFLLCIPEMRADSLQLKNGNFVEGKYLGGTERAVQFEVNGKIRLYDVDEILSISFAAASADGGIPSKNAAPKPDAKVELNPTATGGGHLRTARSNQMNAHKLLTLQMVRGQEPNSNWFEPSARRPAETCISKRAASFQLASASF